MGNAAGHALDHSLYIEEFSIKTGSFLAPQERVRGDGKFFVRGGKRFRIHGVTYGPFAPGEDGAQFPSPQQVNDDFVCMRDIGINSIRTYHVPPDWFLRLADEQSLAVFVDVRPSTNVSCKLREPKEKPAGSLARRLSVAANMPASCRIASATKFLPTSFAILARARWSDFFANCSTSPSKLIRMGCVLTPIIRPPSISTLPFLALPAYLVLSWPSV
jgi:hypothetical protein